MSTLLFRVCAAAAQTRNNRDFFCGFFGATNSTEVEWKSLVTAGRSDTEMLLTEYRIPPSPKGRHGSFGLGEMGQCPCRNRSFSPHDAQRLPLKNLGVFESLRDYIPSSPALSAPPREVTRPARAGTAFLLCSACTPMGSIAEGNPVFGVEPHWWISRLNRKPACAQVA